MKKVITLFPVLFLLLSLNLNAQISTFPYIQTGDNITGWTPIQGVFLWYINPAVKNPDNVSNDQALVCNFYGQPAGVQGIVLSPAFNFTSVSKPILQFYVAYRSFDSQDDSMQVLITTNGGVSYVNTPVPYSKGFSSTPSLATQPSGHMAFNPSSPSQWRHETIDLSAYAGVNNVQIGFRGVSAFGNNLWIDNFIVTNADGYCSNNVTVPGAYSCYPILSTNMTTTGNPAGGVISVTEHIDQDPVQSFATPKIATNSTATAPDGSIYTPNIIAPYAWFTVTYTGNDKSGYANYNISIDVSNFIYLLDVTKLYIVKRTDLTGSWICQNTTSSGQILTASGLNDFSDFAVGGDSSSNPLPVELSSFTSSVSGNDVMLNWTTASEINNSGFDIERQNAAGGNNEIWKNISTVSGNGTTTNINNYSFTDRNLASGKYKYRLKQIDFNGNFEFFNLNNEVNVGIPLKFDLSQNYPNPFNPSTNINFDLPADSKVTLKIFDLSGKEVATIINEALSAGYHSINFNASGLSSGVYFYSLSASNFTATKKMMIVK